MRGLGEKLIATGGIPDHAGPEPSRFQQDVSGFGGDLGGLSAHHACQRDWLFSVADRQMRGGQVAILAIECHQALPATRATHYDGGARESVKVEGVGGLADL